MSHKLKVVLLTGFAGVLVLVVGFVLLAGVTNLRVDTLGLQRGAGGFQLSESFGNADLAYYPLPPSGGAGKDVAVKDRKISYSGSLSLFVKDAESSVARITEIAESAGGFVTASRVYESSAHTKAGTITMEVPAPKFRETLKLLKDTAVEVEEESISKNDVTDQYVDLEKRIASLKDEEKYVLQILEKAHSVDELLRVRGHLNTLQSQIERYQGQLQYVSASTQMSTISATLTADADIAVFGIRWKPLYTVKSSLRGLVGGLADYIDWVIWFVLSLPLILLWGASLLFIVFIVWKGLLWIRGKFFPQMPVS